MNLQQIRNITVEYWNFYSEVAATLFFSFLVLLYNGTRKRASVAHSKQLLNLRGVSTNKTIITFKLFLVGCIHWMSNPPIFSLGAQRLCNPNNVSSYTFTG
jgi:hypothetical protein